MSSAFDAAGSPSSVFFSATRFHGKNTSMSPGTWPPASSLCTALLAQFEVLAAQGLALRGELGQFLRDCFTRRINSEEESSDNRPRTSWLSMTNRLYPKPP